jgi:hypothetical protein
MSILLYNNGDVIKMVGRLLCYSENNVVLSVSVILGFKFSLNVFK